MTMWSKNVVGFNTHVHSTIAPHTHDRGSEEHRHVPRLGKTYFRHEERSDGMPVKCEGHWSVDLNVVEDWAYPG